MKPYLRTPTKTTLEIFDELGFDVAKQIQKHLDDVSKHIELEKAKNKPSKVILEALLKERETMLQTLIPYQYQTPEKKVVIEEEAAEAAKPMAVKLTLTSD